MICSHKKKNRLYERLETTWKATEFWRCPNCDRLLKIQEVENE